MYWSSKVKKRLKNKGVPLVIAVLLVMLLPGGVVPIGIPSVDSGVVLASPDTRVRQPDGDINAGFWTSAPLWSQIDEGSGSPDGTYILCPGNKNSTGECSVQDPTNTGTYTDVQIKVFARKDVAGGHQRGLDADIRIATNLQGQQTLSAALSETFTEYTYTWSGLSFSQSDMNTLQVLFISTGVIGAGDRRQVHIDYYEIILTYTPGVLPDISNTPNSWAFGPVDPNSSYTTGINYVLDSSGFRITNYSAYDVNITISATDMGSGWLLADSGTPDDTHYALWAGTELTSGLYNITVTSTGTPLITVLASGTRDWGLKLMTPTSFTDGALKTGTVTLTATQA